VSRSLTLISGSTGTIIAGDFTGGAWLKPASVMWDGVTSKVFSNCGSTGNTGNGNVVNMWTGKDLGTAYKIGAVKLYAPSDANFDINNVSDNTNINILASNVSPTVYYGDSTAVWLGAISQTSVPNGTIFTINSTDTLNTYRYVWAVLSHFIAVGTAQVFQMAQIEVYTTP
jgi:hypothetical protein